MHIHCQHIALVYALVSNNINKCHENTNFLSELSFYMKLVKSAISNFYKFHTIMCLNIGTPKMENLLFLCVPKFGHITA